MLTKKLDDKQSHYVSKLLRTLALFSSFLAFGICRSIQGPTLLELQKQVEVDTATFQIVFLMGAITFPSGNFLAGFLAERLPLSFLLFISTLILSISISFVPFSPNINVLAAATAGAEFALGLLDTGGNVYCLELWGSKSGPYFNALHMIQGIGFFLAPLLAESVLDDGSAGSPERKTDVLAEFWNLTNLNLTAFEDAGVLGDFEHLNFTALFKDVFKHSGPVEDPHMLTDIQKLYLCVGLIAFIIALSFLPGIPPDTRTGSYDFPEPKHHEEDILTEKSEKKGLKDSLFANHETLSTTLVIVLMTLYFFTANGLAFAFGSFLTAYAVKSSLMLTPSIGARTTSVYYAAQIAMRALNIALVTRIPHILLLVFFMTSVASGSILMFMWQSQWGLSIGTALVGLGSGSLFPMGLLWMQSHMELSGQVTALYCLATSLGAQLFRFPEAAFIDSVPEVHLYLLAFAITVSIIMFAFSFFVMRWRSNILEAKAQRYLAIKNNFNNFAKTVLDI